MILCLFLSSPDLLLVRSFLCRLQIPSGNNKIRISCLCQGIGSQGEWFSWAFGICRDKVICDLTGAVLNKQEEALWKHMMGKKFQHKLGELFFMLILFFFFPLVCCAAAES